MIRLIPCTTAFCLILLLFHALPAQEIKVDEPRVCLKCHDDFQQTLGARHVHTPVKSGKCSQCHNPHASRHANMLDEPAQEQCHKCHSREKLGLDAKVVHDPVGRGECLNCHDAHSSPNVAQLRATQRELCATCHEQVKDWQSRSVQHAPFGSGQCTACHNPHSSANANLSKQDTYTLCSSCHQPTAQLSATHKGTVPQGAACTACHDPHASKSPGLIMPLLHPPYAANNCQACHTGAKASGSYAIQGKISDLCVRCHNDIANSYSKAYRHVPPDKNECTVCHNAHASSEPPLLRTAQVSLCLSCHTTPANLGEDFKISPHKELSCVTCHSPHGAENRYQLLSDPVALCSVCHQHQHSVTHPLGAGVVDPRDQSPMTCKSCHQIHLAPFQPLLPMDGSGPLCIQCHKGK